MQRLYGSQLTVVKIPKSGGVCKAKLFWGFNLRLAFFQVVELDHGYRERIYNYQLHNYMYGQVIQPPAGITNGTLGGESLTDFVLSPSSTVINFGDLQIYRIGSGR